MTGGRLAVVVGAAVLVVAVAGDANARHRLIHPPPLSVRAGDAKARATLGTYCFEAKASVRLSSTGDVGGMEGVCADSGYPLPTPQHLPVHPLQTLDLSTHLRARGIWITPEFVSGNSDSQVGPSRRARRPDRKRRRWRYTVPGDLRGANVLSVNVIYAHGRGEANFWIGIDSPTAMSRKVRVPTVVGTSFYIAECKLVAAGLKWRLGQNGKVHAGRVGCPPPPMDAIAAQVQGQIPAKKTRVPRGSVVTLLKAWPCHAPPNSGCA